MSKRRLFVLAMLSVATPMILGWAFFSTLVTEIHRAVSSAWDEMMMELDAIRAVFEEDAMWEDEE